MLKSFPIAGASRFALLASAGIAAIAFTAPVAAQDTPSNPQDPVGCIDDNSDGVCDPEGSADGASNAGGIVVTGSRIRRPNLDSTVPITSIGGEQFFQLQFLDGRVGCMFGPK